MEMEEKKIYIYNKHIAPITAKARNDKGGVEFTKKFMPERKDNITGANLNTGYTELSVAEYESLVKTSRTFQQYAEKLKLLVVYKELPASARTPHEALIAARMETQKLTVQLETANKEIDALKVQLHDANEKYKTLQSASTDEEKMKPLTDKIFELGTFKEDVIKMLDEHGGKLKELAGEDKDLQKFAEEFVAKTVELQSPVKEGPK
jgi:chromosome segregation ATPase